MIPEPLCPLVSEEEAARILGTTPELLVRHHVRGRRLKWYKGTRTFARCHVEALRDEILKELTGESEMVSEGPALGLVVRTGQRANLVL